jgi:50S ribosomal protein L16 3-hydroxylase
MLSQVEQAIKQVRWDKQDIANFLGCYLSEPKPHIFFDAPEAELSSAKFKQSLNKGGVMLSLTSQMLCHDGWIFINGEALQPDQHDYPLLRSLADERVLAARADASPELIALLYQWYLDGYISPI